MNEPGDDLVGRRHQEAVERLCQQKAEQLALVQAMHQQALDHQCDDERRKQAFIEQIHREALDRNPHPPRAATEPQTIHYTDLPDAKTDSPLYKEWNTYRHEAARLLAEGHAGKHVLIKDEAIIGMWETEAEALHAGYERFLGQAFLVHQVQEREPVLRSISIQSCRNT